MKKSFVGFGFGAIQAGLFLYEAHASGQFDRFVVAEGADSHHLTINNCDFDKATGWETPGYRSPAMNWVG